MVFDWPDPKEKKVVKEPCLFCGMEIANELYCPACGWEDWNVENMTPTFMELMRDERGF